MGDSLGINSIAISTAQLDDLAADADVARSFRTYFNYVKAVDLLLEDHYGIDDVLYSRLGDALTSQRGYQRLKPRSANRREIEKILRNTWAIEIVIRQSAVSGSVDVASCANLWATVQLYYAVFHAARAFCMASGWFRSQETHSQNLRDLSAIVRERDLFPAPWDAWCAGHPMSPTYGGCVGPDPASCNSLTAPFTAVCPAYLAMMLRTTRKRSFEEARVRWIRTNRKKDGTVYSRVSPKHQGVLASGLPPTTIFHFLYRMRARSNYHDADAFIMGIAAGDDAFAFNRGIVNLLRATLFVFECAIARCLGWPAFADISSSFVMDVGRLATQALAPRVEAQSLLQ